MTADHRRIQKLLGDEDEATDTTLRGHSLKRALSQQLPTTLTPYEWEQWYADHGVPDSHIAKAAATGRHRWWHRWTRKQ